MSKPILNTIRLVVFDSDGVLTDGGVYMAEDGREFRRFHILDGLGIKRLMQAGIEVAVISSARCESIVCRMRQLGVERVHIGVEEKLRCLENICQSLGIGLSETAYMGDDLPDLPVMKKVAFACTPANGIDEVKAISQYICKNSGGHGAVREFCEYLLGQR